MSKLMGNPYHCPHCGEPDGHPTRQEYAHTEQARKVAAATGWRIDGWADCHGWAGVGIGPVGIHRDSGILEESNWSVVTRDLGVYEDENPTTDYARFGHWAVGWIEEITYDTGDAATVAKVDEWRKALENYPVADEYDYGERDYAELVRYVRQGLECAAADLPGDPELPPDAADRALRTWFDLGESYSYDADELPGPEELRAMAATLAVRGHHAATGKGKE